MQIEVGFGPSGKVVDVLEAVLRTWAESAWYGVGLRPYVGFDPSPSHILKRQNQMIYVGVALALQGPLIRDSVFDINNKATAGLGGLVHASPKRQKPIDVTIGVDTTVGARIGV